MHIMIMLCDGRSHTSSHVDNGVDMTPLAPTTVIELRAESLRTGAKRGLAFGSA